MSAVHEIESAIKRLSAEEMTAIRDWLDNLIEDRLALADRFRGKIERSEKEMAAGIKLRVRPPWQGNPEPRQREA